MMNNPKYITVAVVAVLFLFTGIAFGQWPDDLQQAAVNCSMAQSNKRVRYRRNESHRIPSNECIAIERSTTPAQGLLPH